MRFYRKANFGFNYTDIFTDSTCYALKPGVAEHDIDRVCRQPFFHNLAMHLLNGDYPNEFRVQTTKPGKLQTYRHKRTEQCLSVYTTIRPVSLL